ncbi:MAG: response regulator transcription factor [Cytophagaceae bacterium]|nr:response regulator transcription factor [Gemmatimonadaceae bacterium]
MTELRVLIVDDEEPGRRKLRRMLEAEPPVVVVGEATNGTEAIARIRELDPDLVLLDIQMPHGNGFEVVEAIGPDAMPPVIFVTAYDEHALRAFEVRALDYLLKPVAPERLREALTRVAHRPVDRVDGAIKLHHLLETVAARPYLTRLLVHGGDRAALLAVDRIDWIEADRNVVHLHAGGRAVQLRESISALEERLDPAQFLRVSRSVIVRLDAIRELQPWSHGDYRVMLTDGTTVMWSRRYRARNGGRFEVRSES